MEDSIGQKRVTINGLFFNLDGRFHRPRKSDYQGLIVSNCMEDSIVQERVTIKAIVSNWMEDPIGQGRVTIKALLYQPGWKIP